MEVNGTVFSYGRGSVKGIPEAPGVLVVRDHSYAVQRMKESPTTVYTIPGADANAIYNYYMNLYNHGTPDKAYGGMVIDTYDVLFNNCITSVMHALQVGGVNPNNTSLIFPSDFDRYIKGDIYQPGMEAINII